MTIYAPKAIENNIHPIWVGTIFENPLLLTSSCNTTVCIITDDQVAPLYLAKITGLLTNHETHILILPAGEKNKSWQQLEVILSFLVEHNIGRSATLIALGGGTISDLTGLAASLYRRGMQWIAIPTTILSQADAAIGGKTAINFSQHKNMIGTFYSPKVILLDPSMLLTLSDQAYFSGFAEIIKHALIADKNFFDWLEKNTSVLVNRDLSALIAAISKSVSIKANIVAEDPYDLNYRHLLNAGHTIGHAIEAASAYSLNHGETISIGLIYELKFAKQFFQANIELERIISLCQQFYLPVNLPANLALGDILQQLKFDKKISHKKIKFPLIQTIGESEIVELNITQLIDQFSTISR